MYRPASFPEDRNERLSSDLGCLLSDRGFLPRVVEYHMVLQHWALLLTPKYCWILCRGQRVSMTRFTRVRKIVRVKLGGQAEHGRGLSDVRQWCLKSGSLLGPFWFWDGSCKEDLVRVACGRCGTSNG
ncbi:hypothetical protein B296_00030759 [Ensete ventricosum]|uniref:Uncharacterized protein n=1 Tax=Ensete ventricosum TaxID=4639 RepID=A0A426ZAU4_ENSVE|nr:hypothetical protein B296_00030759 [Ensete ventricosum]